MLLLHVVLCHALPTLLDSAHLLLHDTLPALYLEWKFSEFKNLRYFQYFQFPIYYFKYFQSSLALKITFQKEENLEK